MIVPTILLIQVVVLLLIMGFLVAYCVRRFVEYRSWTLFSTACSLFVLGCFGLLMHLVGLGLADTTRYIYMAWLGLTAGTVFWVRCRFSPVSLSAKELQFAFVDGVDLAVVCDNHGAITTVNHPQQFAALFPDCPDLESVLRAIAAKSSQESKPLTVPDKPSCWELNVAQANRDFLVSFFPVVEKDAELGRVLLFHDITELKTMERRIIALNQELALANEQLEDYIEVAHQLEAEQHRMQLVDQLQSKLIEAMKRVMQEIADGECGPAPAASCLRKLYREMRAAVAAAFERGDISDAGGSN